MRAIARVAGAVVALALLSFCPEAAAAGPLTIRVCDLGSPTFKRLGDDLAISCPGKTEPTLTVKGCVGPRVTRVGVDYTITCASWKQYDVIEHKAG